MLFEKLSQSKMVYSGIVRFDLDDLVSEAIADYAIMEDGDIRAKSLSYAAAIHRHIYMNVEGVGGRPPGKPFKPLKTYEQGGTCRDQAHLICSLLGTCGIHFRQLSTGNGSEGHSVVEVGMPVKSEAEIDYLIGSLEEFYEANSDVFIGNNYAEKHIAGNISARVYWHTDEYGEVFFPADTLHSVHLGHINRLEHLDMIQSESNGSRDYTNPYSGNWEYQHHQAITDSFFTGEDIIQAPKYYSEIM